MDPCDGPLRWTAGIGSSLEATLISGYHLDMAKIKVSTVLDEHLFRRAKLESVRQRKPLSELLGEALERYLAEKGNRSTTIGVAAETWGSLRIGRAELDQLLADEVGLFDT
jgi:hypothetical protein